LPPFFPIMLAAWLMALGFLGILTLYYNRLVFVKFCLQNFTGEGHFALVHCAILSNKTAVGSMQWLVQDPIPFLVLLCLVLITVWLLRR